MDGGQLGARPFCEGQRLVVGGHLDHFAQNETRFFTEAFKIGDPRAGTDPVECIESIPFSETRNYVQRVLKNTIVYRHRLTGQPVEITLSQHIRRGRPR